MCSIKIGIKSISHGMVNLDGQIDRLENHGKLFGFLWDFFPQRESPGCNFFTTLQPRPPERFFLHTTPQHWWGFPTTQNCHASALNNILEPLCCQNSLFCHSEPCRFCLGLQAQLRSSWVSLPSSLTCPTSMALLFSVNICYAVFSPWLYGWSFVHWCHLIFLVCFGKLPHLRAELKSTSF